MPALSTKYTVADFWKQAIFDIPEGKASQLPDFTRYELINRVEEVVQGQFADVVAEAYMDYTTMVPDPTAGKYYVSGASWDVDLMQLTATMDTNFTSADVGKFVVFNNGATVYCGTIISRQSNTVVTLQGDNLPAADIVTVTYVLVLNTLPSGDTLDVSSVKLLRYGNQLNLQLRSTLTNTVVNFPREGFPGFITTGKNRNTIIWALVGTTLYLKKGDSLSTYGTLTLWYPRLPLTVSADTDNIDLLDGAMIQIGIVVLRNLIARRLDLPIDTDKEQLRELVVALYNSMKGSVSKEELKSKVEALL